MPEEQKTITLGRMELDPSEAADYKAKIAAARAGAGVNSLKGATPIGHVERPNIPLMKRGGEVASPISSDGGVQPRPPGSPILRPETAQQLKDMATAQESQVEEEVKKEMEKEKTDDLFEMFDFGNRNEADRILNNKTRRKEIEARLEPMKLEDLIMRDEVQQEVPIVPGKFVATYRSATPQENLFIKRIMADEKTTSDQYLLEKYGLCQLTCALVAVNGKALPDHRNMDGEPDEDLFNKKLKVILKKSGYIVADLGLNFYWFDLRVRRLISPDDLKNG